MNSTDALYNEKFLSCEEYDAIEGAFDSLLETTPNDPETWQFMPAESRLAQVYEAERRMRDELISLLEIEREKARREQERLDFLAAYQGMLRGLVQVAGQNPHMDFSAAFQQCQERIDALSVPGGVA